MIQTRAQTEINTIDPYIKNRTTFDVLVRYKDYIKILKKIPNVNLDSRKFSSNNLLILIDYVTKVIKNYKLAIKIDTLERVLKFLVAKLDFTLYEIQGYCFAFFLLCFRRFKVRDAIYWCDDAYTKIDFIVFSTNIRKVLDVL